MVDKDGHNITPNNFGPASAEELIVFGAARPAFGSPEITEADAVDWLAFMQGQKIQRICCLLGENQLKEYGLDLPHFYRQVLGADRVSWFPVPDGELASVEQLKGNILPFLDQAVKAGERVVVHCAAGMGRTGLVLAAWLVHHRGLQPEEALWQVRQMGRNPTEVVEWGKATMGDILALLQACRR
ncbi:MAG: dual specificity protein phosphatase family protein [Anaerolineales bacterium]|nr:dual specificity protein phosphatase family protein [Anaerolineales bacterium]